MNKQDSYEELLEVEKKRKKHMELFKKFLSSETNSDNETIKKILADLVLKREISPLEKTVKSSDNTDQYNSLDIFISSRNKHVPQTYLHALDSKIISIYGEMILSESLHDIGVFEGMIELCMEARKKEIDRLAVKAELQEKKLYSGVRYAKFLCIYKGMEKESALSYVNHLLEIEKASEESRTINENNVVTESDKADYPYPPSKGNSVSPVVNNSSTEEVDILHKCKLSSDINSGRILHNKQKQERAERTFSMEDMKGLDENINRRISSLFCKIISAKTSHEIDVLNGVIDSIFNKKSDAVNALSKITEVMRSDQI